MQEMKVDDVDKVLDEINDQNDQLQQINTAMQTPIGDAANMDEDELARELEVRLLLSDEYQLQQIPGNVNDSTRTCNGQKLWYRWDLEGLLLSYVMTLQGKINMIAVGPSRPSASEWGHISIGCLSQVEQKPIWIGGTAFHSSGVPCARTGSSNSMARWAVCLYLFSVCGCPAFFFKLPIKVH